MLSQKTKEAIRLLQNQYPEKRSALIPALHIAQNEVGFLPQDVQEEVAHLFDIDPTEVRGIVSFYDMFFEKPVGKHLIHVCKNLSCMLRGSDCLMKAVCEKLQVKPGETTADGLFTVIASECLAACDKAPMMLVDDKVVGPVQIDELDAIFEKAKESKGHPSPIHTSEVTHG